jgi:DNA phosphorothioation-dependent restriction protein DptG
MNQIELRACLTSKYQNKGQFKHVTGKQIKLLPYITNPKPTDTETSELHSWLGLSGEIARLLSRLKLTSEITLDVAIAGIQGRVNTEHLNDLKHVIKTTAFDSAGNLLPFHTSIFRHLPLAKSRTLRNFARLVVDVFLSTPNHLDYPKFSSPAGNVLFELINESLPELELDSTRQTSDYIQIKTELNESFERDWSYLCQQENEVNKRLPELVKFYSFQYQIRLAERLDSLFEKMNCRPIHFTLDWEKCSSGRTAYVAGWKRIEPKVKRLFSHANCLELLNTIEVTGLPVPYDYLMLKDWVNKAAPDDVTHYASLLEEVISFYRNGIAGMGFRWEEFESKLKLRDWGHQVLDRVHYLWLMVECQFRNSDRNAAAGRYSGWAVTQMLGNYGKRRGRIGYTLALSREQLMFLTWLVIGDQTKLRLHEFWAELEKRGVAFDRPSKLLIVELFEKLNLLEKKSDSGDAQYVRRIV